MTDTTREIPGIPKARRERVEQLIARGWDATDIAERLRLPLEDVAAVWQRMDAICDMYDAPRRERVSA